MLDDYSFPVELRPISTEPDGFIVPNRQAVIRTDTMRPIAVVSKKYALLPHADVVGNLRESLKGQELQEVIRVTHNGARMYLEITLPNVSLKIDGDQIAMRLIVANSYDGSRKVHISFGAIRLVCSNGMTIGRQLLSLNHRHVGDVTLQVAQVREQTAVLTKLFKSSAPTMQKMAITPLASPSKFFKTKTLRIPAYLAKIAGDQFKHAEHHSVWDAYNALTFAITHRMKKNNPELGMRFGKSVWSAAVARLE